MDRKRALVIMLAIFLLGAVSTAHAADNYILSTKGGATLGGLTFEDGDLVEYDPDADTSTLFFDEDLFSHNEDIDAVHLLGDGNIILSTRGGATLGGLTFEDGDLVKYDFGTDTASLFFDEDLFSHNGDIDAVYVRSNSNLILSTKAGATLGGLTFEDGDLAEYNFGTDTASLFFDEDLFSHGEDIDAVHVLDNGNILLSTNSSATLGGLTFEDGDVAEYNPTTNLASLFHDEDLFGKSCEDVDAITMGNGTPSNGVIPEPATTSLLILGLFGGLLKSKRKGGEKI